MTVAVVAPLPPIRSGIAAHSENILRALRDEGVPTVAVSWVKQYPKVLFRRQETDGSDKLDDVQWRLHWARPWGWRAVGREVGRSADIMFIPWVTPFHALIIKTLMRSARIPTVILVHNAKPHEWFPATQMLTRAVLNDASRLIAHSQTVVDDLRSYGVVTPTVVTPHPPNFEPWRSPVPSGPPNRLLFVGFVRAYKGLDLLIEALAKLPHDYGLTVAGEFWSGEDTMRELLSAHNLEERVEVLNRYVPDEELSSLLASHHLVVVPYKSATQSGIVPLAFAAGRPVVATNVGGLAEAVSDRVNGILCPPDSDSMARAIQMAASDYSRLAAGAAATNWTWSDVARAIVDTVPSSE